VNFNSIVDNVSKGKYYFSKSLEKGMNILSLFSRDTPVLTQSQIARSLGLNMTSTYRYINTLVEMGYLEKDARTKEIRPTLHCLVFCNNLLRATDHFRLIKTVVDRVHRENNISIDVVWVEIDTIVRLYHREAEETLTYHLPDRSKNCLHNTALGKAYLSTFSDGRLAEKMEKILLTEKTEKSIVEEDALWAELRKTRARGYSMAEEEYLRGLIAIGAPLVDPVSGEGVGAVSFDFSILQHNASEVESRYQRLIIETARTLSELLPSGKGD
jgi:DNA-binding IclR family transcriptional regulator